MEKGFGGSKNETGVVLCKGLPRPCTSVSAISQELRAIFACEYRDVSSVKWTGAHVLKKGRVIGENLWPDDASAGLRLDVKNYDRVGENQSWWVELESAGEEWWVCVAGVGFRTKFL